MLQLHGGFQKTPPTQHVPHSTNNTGLFSAGLPAASPYPATPTSYQCQHLEITSVSSSPPHRHHCCGPSCHPLVSGQRKCSPNWPPVSTLPSLFLCTVASPRCERPPEGVTHCCRCRGSAGGPAAPGVCPSSSSGPIFLPSSLFSRQTDLHVQVRPRCLSRHGASPAPCATSPVSPQAHHLSNMSWEQKPPRPGWDLIL